MQHNDCSEDKKCELSSTIAPGYWLEFSGHSAGGDTTRAWWPPGNGKTEFTVRGGQCETYRTECQEEQLPRERKTHGEFSLVNGITLETSNRKTLGQCTNI